jgi:DNA-binding PadR family transcriptional regulator
MFNKTIFILHIVKLVGGETVTEEHSLFCIGKNHKTERFLEVCLLLLLYDEVGYGYGLIEGLSFFGFSENELNVSTLYRTLRKMEKENLVISSWKEGGPGPQRRVYKITENGKNELNQWIKILKVRKARIEKLIDRYDEKRNENKHENCESEV